MSETKQKHFTIDEKQFLVASLIGSNRNVEDGLELVEELLNSLAQIVSNFRTLNLNEDEIMNISYSYDEIVDDISSILSNLTKTLNSIFNSDSLIESEERLKEKFLYDDDLRYTINRIDLFEEIHNMHKLRLRDHYLQICDTK